MTIAGTALARSRCLPSRFEGGGVVFPMMLLYTVISYSVFWVPYEQPGPCEPRSDPSPSKIGPKGCCRQTYGCTVRHWPSKVAEIQPAPLPQATPSRKHSRRRSQKSVRVSAVHCLYEV